MLKPERMSSRGAYVEHCSYPRSLLDAALVGESPKFHKAFHTKDLLCSEICKLMSERIVEYSNEEMATVKGLLTLTQDLVDQISKPNNEPIKNLKTFFKQTKEKKLLDVNETSASFKKTSVRVLRSLAKTIVLLICSVVHIEIFLRFHEIGKEIQLMELAQSRLFPTNPFSEDPMTIQNSTGSFEPMTLGQSGESPKLISTGTFALKMMNYGVRTMQEFSDFESYRIVDLIDRLQNEDAFNVILGLSTTPHEAYYFMMAVKTFVVSGGSAQGYLGSLVNQVVMTITHQFASLSLQREVELPKISRGEDETTNKIQENHEETKKELENLHSKIEGVQDTLDTKHKKEDFIERLYAYSKVGNLAMTILFAICKASGLLRIGGQPANHYQTLPHSPPQMMAWNSTGSADEFDIFKTLFQMAEETR